MLTSESLWELNKIFKIYIIGFLKMDDLYEVNVVMFQLTAKWKNFGISIGIRDVFLNIIEKNYACKSQHCFTETIARWLNGEGQPSTWREAVKAAIDCSSTTVLETLKFAKGENQQLFIRCRISCWIFRVSRKKMYLFNTAMENKIM